MLYKKAQSSVEFFILVGFLMFFFIVFFIIVQESSSSKIREKKDLIMKDIALSVQDEVNLATESSEGYYREFKIPENIGGENYYIDIIEETVYVRTEGEKSALSLPIANVTGNVAKGWNVIRKENGVVKINV